MVTRGMAPDSPPLDVCEEAGATSNETLRCPPHQKYITNIQSTSSSHRCCENHAAPTSVILRILITHHQFIG